MLKKKIPISFKIWEKKLEIYDEFTKIDNNFVMQKSSMLNDDDQYDNLYQLLLDLNNDKSQDDVHEILINALTNLEENISNDFAKELFILILKCFSLFPKEFIPIFEDIMEIFKMNSYFIIITAAILSFY